jgi:hypothetical protein
MALTPAKYDASYGQTPDTDKLGYRVGRWFRDRLDRKQQRKQAKLAAKAARREEKRAKKTGQPPAIDLAEYAEEPLVYVDEPMPVETYAEDYAEEPYYDEQEYVEYVEEPYDQEVPR